MCGGGDMPEPEYQKPPVMADPAIQDALAKNKQLQARRKGRQMTSRSGPGGVIADEGMPKTLLGA